MWPCGPQPEVRVGVGATRRSRGERPAPAKYRVTARDLEMLHAVGRMRVATTGQVARLFFRHASAATRRIAKLFALGLVIVACVDLNRENLVALTRKGLALLVAEGAAEGELHLMRRIERHDRHLEAINDLRVGLVIAARARPVARLDTFLADHDLRRTLGRAATHAPYIPDALVRLELGSSKTVHIVWEVDLGSEWSAHLRDKIARVHDLAHSGEPLYGLPFPWRPVFLVADGKRAQQIARLVVDAGGGDFWAIGLLATVSADPFGAVYALARDLAGGDRGAAPGFTRRLVPMSAEVS